jgi:7-cyano-7-deazaguanine synthase
LKAIVILSGGMDSTTTLFIAKYQGYEVIPVHFNYGQRTEKKELKSFNDICEYAKIKNKYIIDIPFFKQIGASALVDENLEVPTDGLKPGIPITYVPFRNGIFLSIAAAIAEKEGAKAIFIGVVEEDSSGYPDCREDFIKKMQEAINAGTKPETQIEIKTPLIHLKKEDIVKEAIKYNVPLELTWSCYQNGDEACGVCDSCRLRLKGFEKAGIKDKIPYKVKNEK